MTKIIVAFRNFAIGKYNAAEKFFGRNARYEIPPTPSPVFGLGKSRILLYRYADVLNLWD
jgi:hypothetical protein